MLIPTPDVHVAIRLNCVKYHNNLTMRYVHLWAFFTHNFFLNTLDSMLIMRSFISGWTFPTEQINLTRNLPRTIKVTNSGKLWPCWQLKRNQAGSSEHARASRIARLFVDYYVPSAKSFLFSHQPFHLRLYLISFTKQSS